MGITLSNLPFEMMGKKYAVLLTTKHLPRVEKKNLFIYVPGMGLSGKVSAQRTKGICYYFYRISLRDCAMHGGGRRAWYIDGLYPSQLLGGWERFIHSGLMSEWPDEAEQYRILSFRRALHVDNQSRKTGKPPSSVSRPKLYWATFTGDWQYYAQTGSMENDAVGDVDVFWQVLGQIYQKYCLNYREKCLDLLSTWDSIWSI